MEDKLLPLAEAAADVGVSPERLRQFIREKRLVARKLGHFWVVQQSDLDRFKRQPRVRTGRPRST